MYIIIYYLSMPMTNVLVIADSISPTGYRLTTLQLLYPRFIHAELLTHRVFSRNSASSRAIPIDRTLQMVKENPVLPNHWGKNCKGMQAKEELSDEQIVEAERIWLAARDSIIGYVEQLKELGLHKQLANRLLEPWLWIQTVVSSTEWNNFLKLRDHPDAQPEIQVLARMIKTALQDSEPERLEAGEWHLPYIGSLEKQRYSLKEQQWMSAARCARVSYWLRDGQRSTPESDFQLFQRLAGSDPKHLSPLEHQALCMGDCLRYANFIGWKQLRSFYE